MGLRHCRIFRQGHPNKDMTNIITRDINCVRKHAAKMPKYSGEKVLPLPTIGSIANTANTISQNKLDLAPLILSQLR